MPFWLKSSLVCTRVAYDCRFCAMSRSRAWILIVAIASLATSHRAERTHEPLYDVSVHVGPGEPVCLDVPPAQPTGRPTCECVDWSLLPHKRLGDGRDLVACCQGMLGLNIFCQLTGFPLPSHQLTWKCPAPCRKTTFLLERVLFALPC